TAEVNAAASVPLATPQAAAELILAESAAWRGALCEIRAARLMGKQAMLKATTHVEAEGYADTAIDAIRAISKAYTAA
ncbi:hypothetical protein ACC817_36275, partial [Rhizobium ruizarguesonis]